MASKRIGFVDDDLDNFHANTYLTAIRGPLAERGWRVAGATALQAEKGRVWAGRNDVAYYDSVAELAADVDVFAVLAPSTPETHLGLCEQVFPCGKTTFVDKTFAPDATTAQRLFTLADEFGVAVQTTSALRTTNVQAEVVNLSEPLVSLSQWAGGASFAEYGVHPVELAVSCLGPDAQRLVIAGPPQQPTVVIEFSDSRVATIDFNSAEYVPFVTMLTTARSSRQVIVDDSKLFVDAAAAILDFFEAGRALIPRAETLTVMRILDAAKNPAARAGWVRI
jgi:hypothetical protein